MTDDTAAAREATRASLANGDPGSNGHANGSAEANGRDLLARLVARETVSVVIPAKDEERNVAWVLRRLPAGIDEVILVDGNSTDETVAVARAVRPDIVVVAEHAPGKGAAVRTGMEVAHGDVIVLLDADGSMDPREIQRYVDMAHDADLVKGSRFAERGASDDISLVRRLGNRTLLGLVNLLYGAHLTDLCYGFCSVRRDALGTLALESDGFEIETEMTVRALRTGLRIGEVPSYEAPRRYGSTHLRTVRDGSRVLRTLLRERMAPARRSPARAAAGTAAEIVGAPVADALAVDD